MTTPENPNIDWTENDLDNLRFLLIIKDDAEEFHKWANSIDNTELTYAMGLVYRYNQHCANIINRFFGE